MSCSCRAVSWRTFVRGLAQVHRLDASTAAAAAAAAHYPVSPLGSLVVPRIGRSWAAAREGRGLHTSRCWRQDVSAAGSVREAGDVKQSAETSHAQNWEKSSTAESSSSSSTTTPEKTIKANKSEKEGGKARKRDKYSKARKLEAAEASSKRQNKERRDVSKAKGQSRPYKPDTTQQRHGKARGKERNGESSAEGKTKLEPWQIQKAALKAKFPEGWKPRKRLSPDALAGIRALNAQFPDSYTTAALAKKFEVDPEAIRRILRSKWSPSTEEGERDREERWFRRGKRVWEQKAALGVKPPKMWRMEGVTRDPGYHEWSKRASQREREWEEEEIRKYREVREKKKKKQQQQQQEQGEGGPTRE